MKFKLNEIRLATEGLSEILQKELPVKTAYWLARFLSKVEAENASMEKARMNLIKKHAKKDKEGNPVFILDKDGKSTSQYDIPDMEAFQNEFIELTNEEVEIDFKPIKLEQLGDINLKPIILAKLGKIIEE
uniref:Uncharacterized protein n=1 Tax=viral metagenome TaxID=1070528 RepID=A0A6M3K520_9ZZZZ